MGKVVRMYKEEDKSFDQKMLELENKTQALRDRSSKSVRQRRFEMVEAKREAKFQPWSDKIDDINNKIDQFDSRSWIRKHKVLAAVVGFFFDIEED